MVTYRHKILLRNLRDRLRKDDIENIKLILLFLAVFGIASFFIVRILETVNKGLEAQQRTEIVARQVEELENENKFLKSQKEAALSDSELEAQYRALGYKKQNETVYIVAKNATTPTLEVTPVAGLNGEQEKNELHNWQKWFLKLFK